MSEDFDPYRMWLGIPTEEQPPHHYRLLGVGPFEADPDVVQEAADRQMAHVQKHKLGRYSQISQKLLNELSAAKICLLTPDKKRAYDAALRPRLQPKAAPAAAPMATAMPFNPAIPMAVPVGTPMSSAPSPLDVIAEESFRRPRRKQKNSAYLVPLFLTFIGLAALAGLAWANWPRLEQMLGNQAASSPPESKSKSKTAAPKQSKKMGAPQVEHPTEPDDQLHVPPLPADGESVAPPKSDQAQPRGRSKKPRIEDLIEPADPFEASPLLEKEKTETTPE